MNTKTRIILIVLGVIIILIAVFLGKSKPQTQQYFLHWSYYPEYGDSDVAKLRAYEVSADSVIMRVVVDSINIQWTTHAFSMAKDGKVHYFVITAIDTADNESEFSNFGVLDLGRPVPVRDVTITR